MRFTKSITFLLTFLTFIFAQTANLSLTNYDADSGSVDVYMVNDGMLVVFNLKFQVLVAFLQLVYQLLMLALLFHQVEILY